MGQDTRRERVTRIDLQTGARRPWLDITPPDSVGASGVVVFLSRDGRYYTYCYQRLLSDLYIMPRPR